MEEKVKVIDQITERHPALGVDKGWSCYTGGMRDSGSWYFRKMLNEPIGVLQSFLNHLIEQENKPKQPEINQYDAMTKFHQEVERRLMWGK